VRVYWEDTDGGGIVYYGNYLRFLERARTEWLRARGVSQGALRADAGIQFSVVSVNVSYRRPAQLDDALTVTCEPQADGRASVRFAQRIFRGEELLLDADVRVACLDAKTLRPKRLPEFVLEAAE
jgi:acyl-CoA thioester hydrolase